MFFSDLHVQLLARGILNPGEQLVGQTVTTYVPWWALGLIQRQYLVLATDQRIIVVDHRVGFFPVALRLHAVDTLAWSNVKEARVKGIFKKKLRIVGVGERGPVSLNMRIPNGFFGLLAPMKNNMAGARSVAAAFQGAAQTAHALGPASQGFGHPQVGYAQAPQLPMQAQPSLPQQNAPGYASVPPPPVSPYGIGQAPVAGPPSAPPGYPPRSWS
jgi:hypothetical protein